VAAHALAAVAPPPPSAARLQGFFALDGAITKAVNVPGEHRGQLVRRVWAFIPQCGTGACARVKLVRERASGVATVILRRRSPAFYAGNGTYYAPARCQGRRYLKGERVSYRVTVRVTAAVLLGTTIEAARVRAVYDNALRTGLTPCVSVPADDAARYLGSLLAPAPAPPPAGSIRSERSTRLTTAS
jgi:hypothetical protein